MQLVPNVGALQLADQYQTYLALSKLRLFNSGFTPNANTKLADLVAVETAFSGYTAGGDTLTAWLNPVNVIGGGAQTTSPQVQFAFVPPESDPVSATVAGWFLCDAAGDLVACGTFNNPIAIIGVGDGFPMTIALNAGNTVGQVQCWVFGVEQD